MSSPYLGEIRIFTFNFPPKGWAMCNGQLLPISQNQALFSLLGTTYGGNGQTTFALPNLQGRVPFHMNNGLTLGEAGGEAAHTLNVAEMPAHTHIVNGSANGPSAASPAGDLWATQSSGGYAASANTAMNPASITASGGDQPHENMSPYFVLNFCITLTGIFPSPN